MRQNNYVVIGDSLLDRDLWGVSDRTVPDGGGPVVDVRRTTNRPGGAALAATLLARDGCSVHLVTAIGADSEAGELATMLAAAGVQLVALPSTDATRQKVRLRTPHGTVARIDRGVSCSPSELSADLAPILEGAAAVLASDYGGGVLLNAGIRRSLAACGRRPVPLVWDPHPRGDAPVVGTTVATPNVSEAVAVTGGVQHEWQARALLKRWPVDAVTLTLGESGSFVAMANGPHWRVPAPHVAAVDVCGAGDRFAATVTRVLGQSGSLIHAVKAATAEAAEFVASGGATAVSGQASTAIDTRKDTQVTVAAGGCFDVLHIGHVQLLERARSLGDRLVVLLNSDDSVRRLKGVGRPVVPQADRARMLHALSCVDEVVIFDEDTPVSALRQLRPQFFVKGGDYEPSDLPEEAAMREWGGSVEIVPLVPGWSTTALLTESGAAVLRP